MFFPLQFTKVREKDGHKMSHEEQMDKCQWNKNCTNIGWSESRNTKVHNAKYFLHKICYGQNEIFRMFEVANVCVRDGSSGFRGFT